MSTTVSPEMLPSRSRIRRLLPVAAGLLLLAAGFATTFLGYWSPTSLFRQEHRQAEGAELPSVHFVSLPQIVLTLSGPQMRTLVMSVKLETDPENRASVEMLVPRLADTFNSFLAGIEPSAFERRGILDIIRDEMGNRAVQILGDKAFSDVLITEFRVQ
ncbi:flagellar basal body-associated FliL family protein [Paracoccus sp. MBLB3053]|uniref:Flagellar protein FliL n=1 Tax=Paracoccus aurantius TaxID=3073814 RepID=A0ABU2HQX2_9RHOB|nr:flagellar basal body-associated FliL family protein [Paracoccus sp. MBLB3053]MDS9466940.1 flagellar basal body-associated FliL family protein [Paracoccus sp. MBLB3053]